MERRRLPVNIILFPEPSDGVLEVKVRFFSLPLAGSSTDCIVTNQLILGRLARVLSTAAAVVAGCLTRQRRQEKW